MILLDTLKLGGTWQIIRVVRVLKLNQFCARIGVPGLI